jgi:hypothetical protein
LLKINEALCDRWSQSIAVGSISFERAPRLRFHGSRGLPGQAKFLPGNPLSKSPEFRKTGTLDYITPNKELHDFDEDLHNETMVEAYSAVMGTVFALLNRES